MENHTKSQIILGLISGSSSRLHNKPFQAGHDAIQDPLGNLASFPGPKNGMEQDSSPWNWTRDMTWLAHQDDEVLGFYPDPHLPVCLSVQTTMQGIRVETRDCVETEEEKEGWMKTLLSQMS